MGKKAESRQEGLHLPQPLKADEGSKKAYYAQSLKTGLAQCESHSTSGRSSRGRK